MENLLTKKKITKATFKSFIRRNSDKLFVNQKSSFDGMRDGLEMKKGGFEKVEVDLDKLKGDHEILKGVWLVGRGNDYFEIKEDDKFFGIEVYNSCGTSVVSIEK